ncbi:MAG: hypothetical protein LBS96_04900 [Oscillospiraceae bacterium]|jgi:hypothetical protein|nr:hypothetical protein [Oscillospiraceae bacterium]
MRQPGDLIFWLPAAIAGGVTLLAVLAGILFRERRWNRFAGDRQAMLDEIAALEAETLRLRGQTANAVQMEELESALEAAPEEDMAQLLPADASPCSAALSSRFPLLVRVDQRHAAAQEEPDAAQPTLQVLTDHLRRHAAAHCGLYAPRGLYGSFLGAMAVSDLLLLYTEEGQTAALPNAIAQAMGQPLELTTVQPSWRSPADLLGQSSPATKLYEETHFLRLLYEASWRKGVNLFALQPLMAAPPESYLAPLLPLLELRAAVGQSDPAAHRSLSLTESAWPNDPKRLEGGKLPWPDGLWLLGLLAPGDPPPPPRLRATAMEFCVPAPRTKTFLVPWTQPLPVEAAHLRSLFANAAELYKLPQVMRSRFDALAEHLATQMQCSLGADAAEKLERFAAVCLACGMSSREAVDAYLWHHALRRLQPLEPASLRHQLPALRDFLSETFEKRSIPLAMGLVEGWIKG